MTSDSFDSKTCTTFLKRSLNKKSDAVIESIQGYQMTCEQKDRMIMIKSHLDFVENSISEIDQKLDQMMVPHEHLITLLSTIPGVKRSSAITIISEIGTDMTQFSSSNPDFE